MILNLDDDYLQYLNLYGVQILSMIIWITSVYEFFLQNLLHIFVLSRKVYFLYGAMQLMLRNISGPGSLACKLQIEMQIEIQIELWVGAQDKRLWTAKLWYKKQDKSGWQQ